MKMEVKVMMISILIMKKKREKEEEWEDRNYTIVNIRHLQRNHIDFKGTCA